MNIQTLRDRCVRIITAICVTAVIGASALMCGCHGTDLSAGSRGRAHTGTAGNTSARAAFTPPDSLDTETVRELSFWAKNDSNKAQVEIYERAIADFEELYPNVHINLKRYTDYNKIYNDVITNISTGTTPNICITYQDHIATYLTGQDTVVNLDTLMADPRWGMGGSELRFDSVPAGEVVPQFLEEERIGGSQYGLPFMRSSEALYVNADYVRELGFEIPQDGYVTWDWVWEIADLAAKRGTDGRYLLNGGDVMIPFIYKSTDNMMIQQLRQRGADYTTADGEVLLFNDDAAKVMQDAMDHTATGAFSTFAISSYPANFLNAGQCVFAVDSTAGATWMGGEASHVDIPEEEMQHFDLEILPVPQYDTAHPQMISQGPSLCIFDKQDPQDVLYSWLFIQFMLTDSVQTAYAGTEGYVPVTTRAQGCDAYREYLSDYADRAEVRAAQMLLNNIEHTFITPAFNGSTSVRNAAGQLIEQGVKAVRRHENTDIQAIYADVRSLYRLDQLNVQAAQQTVSSRPMPPVSQALLIALVIAWIVIISYVVTRKRASENAG